MKQSKGPFQAIVLPAFGGVAAAAFTAWATRRDFHPLLTAGLAASIASTVVWVLARVDFLAVSAWTAATLIAWWVIKAPVDAGHLAANLKVSVSTASYGAGRLFTSI